MSLAQPDPTCTVNSTSTLNGVDVAANATVTIALVDPSGVKQWSITCIYTDETCNAATITAALSINYVTMTATFPAPAQASALVFQSQVNRGNNPAGSPDPSATTTFGVFVRTASGYRVGAFQETTQGDATYGWASKFNALVRASGIAPVQGPTSTNNGSTLTLSTLTLPASTAAVITYRVGARIVDTNHLLTGNWRRVAHVQCSPSGVASVLGEIAGEGVTVGIVQSPLVTTLSPFSTAVKGGVNHATSGATFQIQVTGITAEGWVQNNAYTLPSAGSAAVLCVNPNGLGTGSAAVYVLTGSGTSQNTPGAGPTGTGSSITDGTCTWDYVCAGFVVNIIWRLTWLTIEPF